MNDFDTSNSNHFKYTTDVLEFHILGGLTTFGLDRMRVTLKVNRIEDKFHAYRNNIDLYNANSVEKFVRKLAEFLEIGTSNIRRALQELISELENYRLELLDQVENEEAEEYLLSKKERRSAADFLKSKNLLEKTNKLIGQSGVIGEDGNRLLMYLIFTSRKMDNPLNCVSFGSSGSGKTHLQSKVAELIPEEERLSLTSLSANSFYYFKRTELKYKLILIEDLDGADDVLYPLRELQTKKKITKSVVQKGIGGQGKTKNLTVEGPISVAGCTTQESIYEDNSNRSFLIHIDESEVQDEKIMTYQRKLSAGKIDIEEELKAEELLRNAQRLLKPIKIINPFAEYLVLPKAVFKPRRTNAHYLQFIEVITFYHQLQREKQYDLHTGEEYIETTIEDIKYANEILKPILLCKSDNLNGATRSYLEKLKMYLENKGDTVFTNREIRTAFRIAESTLRRYQLLLLQEGYIKRRKDVQGDSFVYEIVDVNEFKELENSINSALNFCIEKIGSKTSISKKSN
ncbi:hypothetical protein [Polaribacter cellanae]|uniref:DNA primase n=1 Tax=Polaribacter cellanae TaxID=2818493 RepID=A0A975H809_9FLAO|nr:hypothetical protein [Polaribacter cellanae]QTE21090.1 hypothetical protein J3359_09530 [Polaribacter cellanae]